MWLCTKLGFFSVVLKRHDEYHVRARRRGDLVNLKAAVAAQIDKSAKRWKIHLSEPADYRFRMVLSLVSVQAIMVTLATQLDYANFKGEIAGNDDQADKLPAYTEFHHAMEMFQLAGGMKKRKPAASRRDIYAVYEIPPARRG